MMTKAALMQSLREFTMQRPVLEFANYGDVSAYRADSRLITRQAHDAMALIRFIDRADSITAADLTEALDGRDRLALKTDAAGVNWLVYCTGQYWCVEYRAAVCRVLSSVLWRWFRESCGCDTREKIQAAAVREFGRPIARRWFQ